MMELQGFDVFLNIKKANLVFLGDIFYFYFMKSWFTNTI